MKRKNTRMHAIYRVRASTMITMSMGYCCLVPGLFVLFPSHKAHNTDLANGFDSCNNLFHSVAFSVLFSF